MTVPVILLLLLASPARCQDDLYSVGSFFTSNETEPSTRQPYTIPDPEEEKEKEDQKTTTSLPENYKNNGNIACPDTCVFFHLTQYCDAYLKSRDLCVPGMACCVSRDKYAGRPSPDLVIPNEKKHSTNKPTTAPLCWLNSIESKPTRKCRGECMSGLFSTPCKNVDQGAYCPDEGTCCMTEKASTRRPAMRTTTQKPLPPLSRCRGFCMHQIMAAFCKAPAVLLNYTHCKLSNSICCDNSKRYLPQPDPNAGPN